jgi:hypothetical protein
MTKSTTNQGRRNWMKQRAAMIFENEQAVVRNDLTALHGASCRRRSVPSTQRPTLGEDRDA